MATDFKNVQLSMSVFCRNNKSIKEMMLTVALQSLK